MGKYTKWILAGLGWAISGGSPIGALLGYALGKHFFSGDDQTSTGSSGFFTSGSTPHRGPYRNTGTQADVNVALMVLIAAIMKVDGNVKKSELNYVKRFLLQNYGEEHGKEMLHVLQSLVQQDIRIDEVCAQIKVNTDYNTRYHMMDFLFGVCGADGDYNQAEVNMWLLIAQYLGIAKRDQDSLFELHMGRDNSYSGSRGGSYGSGSASRGTYNKDPYRVLGIDSSATDDEVRKAYRRMAMKYHPDRVASMNEEMQRNAAEQMKEINQAYEVIKQRRASMK